MIGPLDESQGPAQLHGHCPWPCVKWLLVGYVIYFPVGDLEYTLNSVISTLIMSQTL